MRGELLGKPPVRDVGFCNDQQPARVLVQPMHNPRPAHAADPRQAVAAMREQGVDQGPAGMAGRRVDDHAGGFVDDDEVAVLMNDGEACIFRLRRRGLGRRHGDGIALARFDPQPRLFYRPARARHVALLDESLQTRARELSDMTAEHAIDPLAGIGLGDLDCADVLRRGHVMSKS